MTFERCSHFEGVVNGLDSSEYDHFRSHLMGNFEKNNFGLLAFSSGGLPFRAKLKEVS